MTTSTKVKNVPQLRFKEFSNEWQEQKLEDIATFLDGHRVPLSKPERQERQGIYPYYGASGIIDYVDDYIFDGEYVLLGEDGANIIARNSRLAFIAHGKIWVNNHAHVLQAEGSNYFLAEYLERLSYEDYNTGTAQPKLNASVCKKILVNLPSRGEQKKIADFLAIVDQKITAIELRRSLLKKYEEVVSRSIFAQEIRFKNAGDRPYLNWKESKLSNFLSVASKEKVTDIDKARILTVKLHRKGIFLSTNTDSLKIGATTYYRRNAGDLIYGKQNLFNGALAIVPDEFDGCVSSGDIPSLKIKDAVIDARFLIFYIGRKSYYKKLESVASGSGSKRIHESTLLGQKIKAPSLEEQQKIAEFLTFLNNKISLTESELEEAKNFKKALLQQMLV